MFTNLVAAIQTEANLINCPKKGFGANFGTEVGKSNLVQVVSREQSTQIPATKLTDQERHEAGTESFLKKVIFYFTSQDFLLAAAT